MSPGWTSDLAFSYALLDPLVLVAEAAQLGAALELLVDQPVHLDRLHRLAAGRLEAVQPLLGLHQLHLDGLEVLGVHLELLERDALALLELLQGVGVAGVGLLGHPGAVDPVDHLRERRLLLLDLLVQLLEEPLQPLGLLAGVGRGQVHDRRVVGRRHGVDDGDPLLRDRRGEGDVDVPRPLLDLDAQLLAEQGLGVQGGGDPRDRRDLGVLQGHPQDVGGQHPQRLGLELALDPAGGAAAVGHQGVVVGGRLDHHVGDRLVGRHDPEVDHRHQGRGGDRPDQQDLPPVAAGGPRHDPERELARRLRARARRVEPLVGGDLEGGGPRRLRVPGGQRPIGAIRGAHRGRLRRAVGRRGVVG